MTSATVDSVWEVTTVTCRVPSTLTSVRMTQEPVSVHQGTIANQVNIIF